MFARFNLLTVAATALVLLSCSALPAVQALKMNNICALVLDGSLLASGTSCTNYYLCKGGVATQQTCSNGNYFDKDLQRCLPPSQVNCLSSGQNPCAGHKVGSWVSQPGSCSGFYYCSAKGAELSHCPSGQNFDGSTQMCKFSSEFKCGDTVVIDGSNTTVSMNLCSFVQNGVYFGSPSRCDAWNLCSNNVLFTGYCSKDLYYNVADGKCDYLSHMKCTQLTNDPDLISSDGGPCTVKNTKKASAGCTSYYQCDGSIYKLIPCAKENDFYDTILQTCVSRTQARNDCDRCVGSKTNFVNKYSSTGCTGYLYCKNGVTQSASSCPKNTYFNEVAGNCVSAEPNFGCCNPKYQGTKTVV